MGAQANRLHDVVPAGDRQGVGPGDDHELIAGAGIAGRPDLLDVLGGRDDPLALEEPAFLGEDLVLQVQGADAGPLVGLHGPLDVQRVAVPGVGYRASMAELVTQACARPGSSPRSSCPSAMPLLSRG